MPQPEPRISRFSPALARTLRPGAAMLPLPNGSCSHSQVLDPDHVKLARQVGGQLLGPVFAGVGLAGSQPGDRGLDLARRLLPRLARASLR